MTLSAEERQRIYEEEKVRIEAQQQIKKEQQAKRAYGCLIAFIAIIAFVAVMYYVEKSKEIPKGAVVSLPGGDRYSGVPVDLNSFSEYWDAIGKDNKQKLALLIATGRVLAVDSGTKARTISEGPTIYRIEILEGKHAGRTGYMKDIELKYGQSK